MEDLKIKNMHQKLVQKLALTVPGFASKPIPNPDGLDTSKFSNLSGLISQLFNVTLYLVAFLAFYYLVWGAFAYLLGQGQKENLAKARARIQWALIGLIVVFLGYFIAKYLGEIFKPDTGGLPF